MMPCMYTPLAPAFGLTVQVPQALRASHRLSHPFHLRANGGRSSSPAVPAAGESPDERRKAAEVGSNHLAEMLHTLNRSRQLAGVGPVALHPALTLAARCRAEGMAERGYFLHECPTTGVHAGHLAVAAGYRGSLVGECLAHGAVTPVQTMLLWMESPSHRECIIDPAWRDCGFAFILAPATYPAIQVGNGGGAQAARDPALFTMRADGVAGALWCGLFAF